ncbi:MAG: dephospho-CoA kinase [Pseudomonadota bacterium]
MLKVAITGGSGAGKSRVCKELARLGAQVISLDCIAREIVQPDTPCLKRLIDYFGENIISPDNSLDRRRLRDIILHNPNAKKALDQITHPEILRRLKSEIQDMESAGQKGIVFVESPLLKKAWAKKNFDMIILVSAPRYKRMRRIMQRDNVSAKSAKALIALQPNYEKKMAFDIVIENRGGIKNLAQMTLKVYAQCRDYRSASKSKNNNSV